jgi:hypothetical protein
VDGARIIRELKRDVFGTVELLEGPGGPVVHPVVRRVARGSALPGSGWIARRLLGRERRALRALAGQPGVPQEVEDPALARLPARDGRVPRPAQVLLRSWLEGLPLHLATHLPLDYFDLLDALTLELHRAGVCHNDLHKEQNILVGADGRPALIDFQLASVHRKRGRAWRGRCSEDLRHLQKHRRRYTRDGRGPSEAALGLGAGRTRGPVAAAWRRFGKPLYLIVTRRLLRTRDGELRRPSSGPWPEWTEPLGPP